MSRDVADCVDALVHPDTQIHDGVVDLTLDAVHRVAAAGRVDFGGGELEPPSLAPVATERRADTDEHAWWNLTPGTYVVTLNERLDTGAPLRVEPRPELTASGGHLVSITTDELQPLPLAVADVAGESGVGLRLKENARVARVRPV